MPYILQQLLTESAKQHPDKPAVWARQRTISYRELNERSNQLAHLLRERGIKKGDRVGIYFPKAVESIASMFGVLKAGGVYVPLDPSAPAERIAYIIGNCAIKALITTEEKYRGLGEHDTSSVETVVLIEGSPSVAGNNGFSWSDLSAYPSAHSPELQATTTDLAYILYTSGSTGRPKGVMLSHQNALTFIEWCAETFQVRSEDNLSNHAPLHFDLSVFDVYNTIKAGATVHMVTEEAALFPTALKQFIEEHQISIWYSVPSALVLLLLHGRVKPENFKRLRIILFAGEVFPQKYLKQWVAMLPNVDFYNLYGPTETNVCTYYQVDHERLPGMEKLPIGHACANTEVFAVGDDDKIVTTTGVEGELYVRGPAVTPGYWADPEKTAKMCVPNRFQPNFDEKAYRTGDIVTLGEDGEYYFTGRRDSMIKSRGYRIELGEIEAALLSHAGVKEAAAVAIPDELVGARIKAFVAPHDGNSLTQVELQKHCSTRVPHYMIPEIIELCDSLPKTSTGKVDRVQLAKRQEMRAVPA